MEGSVIRNHVVFATNGGMIAPVILALLATGLGAGRVSGDDPPPADSPGVSVFVSILPQAYFVDRIGGPFVTTHVMVGPGESPASYDPPPRRMAELAGADLYFAIGVPMEAPILPHIRRSFPRVSIVDTRTGIGDVDEPDSEGAESDDHHPTERHAADEHAHGPDPHVWLDPMLAKTQAAVIADALARFDTTHAPIYLENLSVLSADLDSLDAEIRALLAPVRGAELVVFHPAFGYFAKAYGLKQVAIERGGLAPGPKYLAGVLQDARKRGVSAIFSQPQFSLSSTEAIAHEIGVEVRILDPLARDYMRNLRQMAVEIRDALAPE